VHLRAHRQRKTTLAKYVTDRLTAATTRVASAYVNCLNSTTTTGTLAALVRDVGLGRRPSPATSRQFYIDRLQGATDPVLAILDEVTTLPNIELLRALSSLEPVTLVCIGVDEETLFSTAQLDRQTRSCLRTFMFLRLDAYTHDELVDILEYRVTHGLDTSRVRTAAIEYIATLAAGDAKTAIAFLRRAATQAAQSGGDIDIDCVDAIREEARATLRTTQIESLGTHQRALYEVVRDCGMDGISATEVHTRYEARVDKPHAKRTRRRYLKSLEKYGLIEAVGEGRAREYRLPP
jgi:Cdc6-like AAA superfamily ATPase